MRTSTRLLCTAFGPVIFATACANPDVAKQRAFENGNQYFEQQKYDEAIVEYRNAIRQDPSFGEARLKLAEAYAQVGNAGASYTEQIRAADLLPENIEAQLKASAYLLLTQQFEDAKARVQRVLDREPDNVQALLILGNALAGLRDIDGAVAEIQQAIELDPSRSGSYTNLAGLKLAQGDREQARAAYEKAVELEPASIQARIALAMFRWGAQDMAGAEEALKGALLVDSKHVVANRALASYYVSTGRAAEAEQHLKTIAQIGSYVDRIALADYYIGRRRIDDAKSVLNEVAREEGPPRTLAELRLAQLMYSDKHVADAHAALERILMQQPKNPPALVLKAQWLYMEGKLPEARTQAETAVAAAPEYMAAHYMLGTIQAATRDVEGATKSFTEVLRLNPRAAAAQLHLSRLTLASGDTTSSVQFAQQALNNAPGSPMARLSLARGLIAQRKTSEAQQEISRLLKEYPKAAPVHALNGALMATNRDLAGARTAYERALALDANSMEALNGLTLLDLAQKNGARARARVEAQLKLQPDQSDLLTLAARVYVAERDFGSAERVLRHLVDVDESNMTGYSMLGQVYLLQRRLEPARAEFEKRIAANAKDAPAHLMVAMIFEAQGKRGDARKKYEEILAINSRSVIASNNLAYMLADTNQDLDRALELAQNAAKQAPDNAAVQDTLGWVYYQKQLPDLAVQAFEHSVAKDPNVPEYHYHLGLAQVRAGNLVRARRALEAALKLRQDYPDARRALQSIAG